MALKTIGIVLLLLCLGLLYVGYDQYEANRAAVEAMNENPLSLLLTSNTVKPAMPAPAKYALIFGVLTGIGGAVCIIAGMREKRA